MMIHDITSQVGKYKATKRLGRGDGSGQGGTAGRGHKGARSRSGWKKSVKYEGGQMPLMMRMPKRGFSNFKWQNEFHIVNLAELEAKLDNNATVDAAALVEAGIIRDISMPVKVLGNGDLTKSFKVTAAKFSKTAAEKIEKAGGTVTVIEQSKWTRSASPDGWKKQRRESAEAKYGRKAAAKKAKK